MASPNARPSGGTGRCAAGAGWLSVTMPRFVSRGGGVGVGARLFPRAIATYGNRATHGALTDTGRGNAGPCPARPTPDHYPERPPVGEACELPGGAGSPMRHDAMRRA